jgi:transketolase
VALERRHGPVALLLSRQNLPILDRSALAPAAGLRRGAYVLADADGLPDLILIATGSEVHLALDARQRLAQQGVKARVVSMPSWELFEQQPPEYQAEVLPPQVTARVAVEAAVPLGWERYVGLQGDVVGLHRFGASAPYKVLFEQFGFTGENVAVRALAVLDKTRR